MDAAAPAGGDGLSWATAYTELQQAFADAENDESITAIWVAEGTYSPDAGTGDPTAEFLLLGQENLDVLGGFPSGGADLDGRNPSVYETVLTGDLNSDDTTSVNRLLFDTNSNPLNTTSARIAYRNIDDNSRTVLGISGSLPSLVIDGFTLRGGHDPDRGGAIMAANASATLRNLRIESCSGGLEGGAVFFTDPAEPVLLENCTFVRNSAPGLGGAVLVARGSLRLVDCEFNENFAGFGGAVSSVNPQGPSSVEIEGGVYTGNTAVDATNVNGEGGAVYTSDGYTLNIRDAVFADNRAEWFGGGVRAFSFISFVDSVF